MTTASLNKTSLKLLELIVTLQERHHLNQSGIPVLTKFVLEILSSFCVEQEEKVSTERGDDDKKVLHAINSNLIMNHPIHNLNSEYQVIQHLKKFCGYVTPKEIILGTEHVELSEVGNEDVIEKSVKEHIIPFKDSLTEMFNNTELRNLIENPSPSNHGIIESARDSKMWKENEFFQKYPNALMLQLYFDDVELVNPLGSRTGIHKITNFYWSVLNIPEHLRSNLKSIGLIACVNSDNIKEFGYEMVLKDFLENVIKMQSEEGLLLKLSESENVVVRGLLFAVNGDGLALNHIGGFKGISGARHPCRNCSLSKTEMKNCFVEKNLRTLESHSAQLEQILDSSLNLGERNELQKNYGLIGASVLNRLEGFDVTKQLLQDKMHNVLEGVADVCIREVINFMISKGNSELTLETLNSKLLSFCYPDELVKSKPTLITSNHLSAHLRQKASQMMCLLCVLPIILAPFENDINREHLLNLSLLVQITHRLLAYKVNSTSINTLKFMILTHHTRFKSLYPHASITPKFHFMVHGPSTLENFGPCRVSWCMRFEGMNAWYSQAAGQTHNFINIAKSLTQRYQIKRCLDFGLGSTDHVILSDNIFKPVCNPTINLTSYAMGNQVAKCFGIDLNSDVHPASSISLMNFEIQQNSVLLYSDDRDNLPVFCQVKAIFVIEKSAALVLNILETFRFDDLRCSFEVSKTDMYTCVSPNVLLSLQPFPLISTSFGEFIVPLYYDVRVFQG